MAKKPSPTKGNRKNSGNRVDAGVKTSREAGGADIGGRQRQQNFSQAAQQQQQQFQSGSQVTESATDMARLAADIATGARNQGAGLSQQAAWDASGIRMKEMEFGANLQHRYNQMQGGRIIKTTGTQKSRVVRAGTGGGAIGGSGSVGGGGGAADAAILAQERMNSAGIASREKMQGADIGSRERMQGADISSRERMQGADIGSRERMQGAQIAASAALQSNQIASNERMPGIEANAQDDLRKKAAARAISAFNQLSSSRTVNSSVG